MLSAGVRRYSRHIGRLPCRGLLNGWLVAKAGVAPFIATLGHALYRARRRVASFERQDVS